MSNDFNIEIVPEFVINIDVAEKGVPGYTPVKGVDYFDGDPGYTPQKGIDYFDGAKGDTGLTGAKGDTGEKGNTGATGATGANGTNGTNGINGTATDQNTTTGVGTIQIWTGTLAEWTALGAGRPTNVIYIVR